MKSLKFKHLYVYTIALFMFAACENTGGKDSKDVAEDVNDEKMDTRAAEKDAEFAVNAAVTDMKEIRLGELAVSKATVAETKEMAQMMITDHTKTSGELKALAGRKGMTLPSTPSDEIQRAYDRLNEKTGADFDKEYADMMVNDHQEAIRKFEDCANNCNDAELKSWAASTLPALRTHLQHAEHCQEMNKGDMNDKNEDNNTGDATK